MATPTAEINADLHRMVTDIYVTPVYFVVGLTDMAVKKLRQSNLFDQLQMRKDLSAHAEKVLKQAQQTLAALLEQGRRLSERAQGDYVELAERGGQVLQAIRGQQATQLDNTASITRRAMTNARNAVVHGELATVTVLKTGLTEAENVAVTLTAKARQDAQDTRKSMRQATVRTKAAGTGNSRPKNTSAPATTPRKSPSQARTAASAAAE